MVLLTIWQVIQNYSTNISCLQIEVKFSLQMDSKYLLQERVPMLDKFHVYDVSHVSDLPLNLLYVNKITKKINYKLIFSNNRCILQDLVTWNNIEIGLVFDGLYCLLLIIVLVSTMREKVYKMTNFQFIIKWEMKLNHLPFFSYSKHTPLFIWWVR